MNLSRRLKAIADFIPEGSYVADIGTDHALLPINLITTGIASKVIAGDLNEGPLKAAQKNVNDAGLNEKIILKLGYGLEIIEPETQIAVIAGMGGSTIKNIIEKSLSKAARLNKIITQPMSDESFLRLWLTDNGWRITAENLIKEDGIVYSIIAAEPGQEITADKTIISIGPRLFDIKHALLPETILAEINQNNKILTGLKKSESNSTVVKQNELIARNRDLERVIECLSGVSK